MSLHPNDRPPDVLAFRDALFGKQDAPSNFEIDRLSFDMPSISIITPEQIAGYVAIGLFLLSLVSTLLRS
jgi:hypothetical protein